MTSRGETKQREDSQEVQLAIVTNGDLAAVSAVFKSSKKVHTPKHGDTNLINSLKGRDESEIIGVSTPAGCRDEPAVATVTTEMLNTFSNIRKVLFVGTFVPTPGSGIEDGDVAVVEGVDGLVEHSFGTDGKVVVKRAPAYVLPDKETHAAISKMKEMADIREKLGGGSRGVAKRMDAPSQKQFESTAKEGVELKEVQVAPGGIADKQVVGTGKQELPVVHYGTVSCGSVLEQKYMILSGEQKEFKVLGFVEGAYGLAQACVDGNCVFILGASTIEGSAYGQATAAAYAKIFVDNLDLSKSAPIQRTKLVLPDGLDVNEYLLGVALESYDALCAFSQVFDIQAGNLGPDNPMYFTTFEGIKTVVVSPPKSDDSHNPVQDIQVLFQHIVYCALITTGGAVPKSEGAKDDVTPGTCVAGANFGVYRFDEFIATGRTRAGLGRVSTKVSGPIGRMTSDALMGGARWPRYLEGKKVTLPAITKYESDTAKVIERGKQKAQVVNGTIMYSRAAVTEAKVRQNLPKAMTLAGYPTCFSKWRHISTSTGKLMFIQLCGITNSCDATSVKVLEKYYAYAIIVCAAYLAALLKSKRLQIK